MSLVSEQDGPKVVLATFLDYHIGSGSGSKPIRCPIGGPGHK